nr:hypothetical protein [Tanacetum cinerariifolium]
FIDPEISTQADEAQSSRVPVPFSKDSYEAIRQACLVETDTESEPFEDPVETETPESPHIVASITSLPDSTPPTCHAKELEDSDTFGARSTSSNSTTPLSPDHPPTYTSPTLVLFLHRTARMAMRVPPEMSHGISAIKDEEDEEVGESLDFDSESEDAEDEGPTTEDEDPAVRDEGFTAGDEGLTTRDEGPGMRVESLGLEGDEGVPEGQQRVASVVKTAVDFDSESEDAEDEGPTTEDEDPAVRDEGFTAGDEGLTTGDEGPGMRVESLGLEGDEGVPEGQQRVAPVVKTVIEYIRIKYSTQHSSVNNFVVINIPEMDVEPKQIILDPDDQPMWESAKNVASTPNSAIIQLDSEVVKLLIFPFSLCNEAKIWFNELNEESITSWEQIRKTFINKFFPPSLFNRLLLEIRNFSQLICESLIDAWLRLKSMLRKRHGHGLAKRAIIQIFYHGLDEPTQGILDITAEGIFLYKSLKQAFQLLEDKVLFKHDWSTKSKTKHHQESISFADESDSNTDNSRFMEKLKAMDSQMISLNKELQDTRNKYNELREGNASKNNMHDDTLILKVRVVEGNERKHEELKLKRRNN